jgi:hypothetical protein
MASSHLAAIWGDGARAAALAECSHHWISIHQPDFPPEVYWVRQCSMCRRIDGADLAAQMTHQEF